MGQLAIPSSAIVYADTSIFIYSVEVNPDYYLALEPLWAHFNAGFITVVTSELTLMETRCNSCGDCVGRPLVC